MFYGEGLAQSSGRLPPLNSESSKSGNPTNHYPRPKAKLIEVDDNLARLRDKPWIERVFILEKLLGTKIPLIDASIGPSSPHNIALYPKHALYAEENQTWWINGNYGYVVFQNFLETAATGITLAVYEQTSCSQKKNPIFRSVSFLQRVPSGKAVGIRFNWPKDLDRQDRCIDIFDLNSK